MKKKGFTLIELLVVIAIIGILSSVVVVSLNSARAKARDTKRISDLAQIKTALGLYFDSNMQYPAALADLVSDYLPTEPQAPNAATGETYSYAISTDALSYHLGATLEQVASSTGVLASDRDCDSSIADSCWTGDAAASGGFDGTSALVYDLTP